MAIDPTLKHPVQMFPHDEKEPEEGPMSPADYYQKHFAAKPAADEGTTEEKKSSKP